MRVPANDLRVLVSEHGGIEAPAVGRQFGITKIESDFEFGCEVEQRLRLGSGHAAFEEALDGFFFAHPIAREERGQGQFGEHHELGAAAMGLAQKRDQALDDGGAAICK